TSVSRAESVNTIMQASGQSLSKAQIAKYSYDAHQAFVGDGTERFLEGSKAFFAKKSSEDLTAFRSGLRHLNNSADKEQRTGIKPSLRYINDLSKEQPTPVSSQQTKVAGQVGSVRGTHYTQTSDGSLVPTSEILRKARVAEDSPQALLVKALGGSTSIQVAQDGKTAKDTSGKTHNINHLYQ
ncbi:MAG: hypothetical protein KDK69_04190, partial [Chlamydiia bacterium]|nr:hypothetical protein [Chlamydiia bacterium]